MGTRNDEIFEMPKQLRRREKECLSWLCKGKTLDETAVIMNIEYTTILSYIRNLKDRLGCETLPQVICKAIKTGLLSMDC